MCYSFLQLELRKSLPKQSIYSSASHAVDLGEIFAPSSERGAGIAGSSGGATHIHVGAAYFPDGIRP
jgi:hypothetical protein